jgi:iron complex outermembrane receptor protein
MALSEGNSFYVDNSNLGKINVKPQLSTNYQAGTVFKYDRFNAAADVYYVDFKNYAYNGPNDPSGDPQYYGVARGAYYSGFETEATYYLGAGVSAYGNGSVNNAVFKGSKLDVPTVPNATAALGLVFDHEGFFGSLTEKYVGPWKVYDTITNPDLPGAGASRSAKSQDYWLGDLSIGYGRKFERGMIHNFKIRLQVSNIFNEKVQVLDSIDANPANAFAKDAFNVLPVRNYFLTLSSEF